eukprot:8628503-Pyramimonas_sp.AAC.1
MSNIEQQGTSGSTSSQSGGYAAQVTKITNSRTASHQRCHFALWSCKRGIKWHGKKWHGCK